MHFSRRTLLASLGAVACLPAANTRIRAACLLVPDTFDTLLQRLKEMQGLGYTGYSTTMRLMQTQTDRVEEARAKLSDAALDLVGIRATLPKSLDDLSRFAMAARQFGARTLILQSPGLAPDGKFKPEELDEKAKFFDLCAKRCKEAGVVFTYRAQEAEFQNDAAEIKGLIAKTDKNLVYYNLDLAKASKAYPEAIAFFRDNPSRTFAMEAAFGDAAFPAHDLAAAVKHTRWISWLIDAAPTAESRGVMKKVFGV